MTKGGKGVAKAEKKEENPFMQMKPEGNILECMIA